MLMLMGGEVAETLGIEACGLELLYAGEVAAEGRYAS